MTHAGAGSHRAATGAELVRELLATFADPDAFRVWYEDAVVRVYRYLFPRCGGDAGLTEEITQQTFISAIENRSSFAGRSDSVTWLCAIARNKLADHYRRMDRIDRRHLRLVVREIDVESDRTSVIEDRDMLMSALRKMPAMQRAVLVLCYLDDLSVAEAAGILERSESATESLLTRARARLREILSGEMQ
ncbi:MAG: polymerase sigma-70 factor, subfamily [Chloroflexota bacterium]|nr:polymerase sigma-70 factor, subfamily [Chloroflexota bacterium]